MTETEQGDYVLVSPVRDEAKYLLTTIDSIVAQTLRPLRWVIVDDGSSDETPGIADAAADRHPWIRVIHRPKRVDRRVGGGVVRAFQAGLQIGTGFRGIKPGRFWTRPSVYSCRWVTNVLASVQRAAREVQM